MPSQFPLFFAHRGASQLAPENTLPAFQIAYEQGARWLECDVMMSLDEQLFIFHDDTLNRTTGTQGLFYKTPSQILETLDAGSWWSLAFKNTQIPRLTALFELLSIWPLHVNLELKATADPMVNARTAILLAEQLPLLRKKMPHIQIIVSSFDLTALQHFTSLAPDIDLALLIDTTEIKNLNANTLALQIFIQNHPRVVSINVNDTHLQDHHRPLSEHCIRHWQMLHPRLCIYTINDLNRATWLLNQGASGLFSDNIDLIKSLNTTA